MMLHVYLITYIIQLLAGKHESYGQTHVHIWQYLHINSETLLTCQKCQQCKRSNDLNWMI